MIDIDKIENVAKGATCAVANGIGATLSGMGDGTNLALIVDRDVILELIARLRAATKLLLRLEEYKEACMIDGQSNSDPMDGEREARYFIESYDTAVRDVLAGREADEGRIEDAASALSKASLTFRNIHNRAKEYAP